MDLTDFLTALDRAHDHAIPFSVFMENALYHPEFGYYTAHINTVGGRGADFSTSASLLPDLAKAIAAWIQDELRHHQRAGAGIDHVIEPGPGDGALLFNVLRHLRHRLRRTLAFHLVEISPRLEALQRERFAKFGNIHWHRDIRSALTASQGRALLYSNEFVDAFPATALRRNAESNTWEEIRLSFDPEQGLAEVFGHFTPSPPFSATSAASCSKFKATQRIELHESYRAWLQSWLPSLAAGSLLTVDYGDTAENLYHRRPRGTLRAYYKHQRFDGPPGIYARFGKQDLTADVNFTDLAAWGEEHGLETLRLRTQSEFTGSPEPAAAAFRVLHQRTPGRSPETPRRIPA